MQCSLVRLPPMQFRVFALWDVAIAAFFFEALGLLIVLHPAFVENAEQLFVALDLDRSSQMF